MIYNKTEAQSELDKIAAKKARIPAVDKKIDFVKFLTDNLAFIKIESRPGEAYEIIDCSDVRLVGLTIYSAGLTEATRDEIDGEYLKENDQAWFENKRYGFVDFIQITQKVSRKTATNKANNFLEAQLRSIVNKDKKLNNDNKDEIQTVTVQEVEELPFRFDEKGRLQRRYENMELVLFKENISLKFNEMTKKIEFSGIRHSDDNADATFTRLRSICLDNQLELRKDDVYSFAECIADKYRFNPIVDYLERCKNIAKPGDTSEVAKLLTTINYSTTDTARIRFCEKMLIKWLLNCVRIAYNTLDTEYKCEIVITFQGEQGAGKSLWAKSLVPRGFFEGNVTLILDDKDEVAKTLSKWIVELGELGGSFSKSHRDKIKAFISKDKDSWRSPYGRCTNTYPRRTMFIATVNDQEFLVDKTGNRRFVVFPAESLNFEHDINIDLLWGQLVHMLDETKEPIWMTDEERIENELYNKNYTLKTDTELAMDDVFDWESQIFGACKLSDIESFIRQNTGRSYSANAIKHVLLQHKCTLDRFTVGEKGNRHQGRYWRVPFVEGLTLPF